MPTLWVERLLGRSGELGSFDGLPCWVALSGLNSAGYGMHHAGRVGMKYNHREMYRLLRDEIPVGLVLDHLCRNRACFNPWHLEPVTHKVNMSRGKFGTTTHCPYGHSEWRRKGAARDCAACHRDRERNRRKKAA